MSRRCLEWLRLGCWVAVLCGCGEAVSSAPDAACGAFDAGPVANLAPLDANCTFDDDAYFRAKDGWPAGTCFHGAPPVGDAFVAPLPAQPSCPDVPPDFFDDAAIPPPTLQVEIGQLDEVTHAFTPYAEGGFAPVVHGAQGGIHVWAALRVHDPDLTTCSRRVSAQIRGYRQCFYVGNAAERTPPLVQVAPGVYETPPGFQAPAVVFKYLATDSGELCGQVEELRAQVDSNGSRLSLLVRQQLSMRRRHLQAIASRASLRDGRAALKPAADALLRMALRLHHAVAARRKPAAKKAAPRWTFSQTEV